MAVDERIAKIHPRHDHFVQLVDPWHVRVLAKNHPSFRVAMAEYRIQQGVGDAELHAGEILLVWFSVDAAGYLLQEWGLDVPPLPELEPYFPAPTIA